MAELTKVDLKKVKNYIQLLKVCIATMCATHDKNELEEQYDYAVRYIRAIRSINHDRLYGEGNYEMS